MLFIFFSYFFHKKKYLFIFFFLPDFNVTTIDLLKEKLENQLFL